MTLRFSGHAAWITFLTLLTQIGGIAWLIACLFRRRWLAFVALYAALSIAALWIAPMFGRVALPCTGETLRIQSAIYCALNRHYVVPELSQVLQETAVKAAKERPGTITQVLDANFPFLDGFPLLPHLSHDDGRKADIAFYYQDASRRYLPAATRSAIGYFAFEQGPTDCPSRILSLRWDLDWLQPLMRDLPPDVARMKTVMRLLSADPRIGKILLEPHQVHSWGVSHGKVRFQGCRAARHDDHIHVQL